jgi:hypothetical protein
MTWTTSMLYLSSHKQLVQSDFVIDNLIYYGSIKNDSSWIYASLRGIMYSFIVTVLLSHMSSSNWNHSGPSKYIFF